MANWNCLCAGLQLYIWEQLANSHRCKTGPLAGLAHYATVSKSWQRFFERKTFRHLSIFSNEIHQFNRIVHGERRGMVKHVLLNFVVNKRTSITLPNLFNTDYVSDESDRSFTSAVRYLLQVFSGWDIEAGKGQGITLELAPADHVLRSRVVLERRRLYAKLLEGNPIELCSYPLFLYPLAVAPLLTSETFDLGTFSNPPTGVDNWNAWTSFKNQELGRRGLGLDEQSLMNENSVVVPLPRANVVAKLLIRLEFLLNFQPAALGEIIQSLPCLQDIQLERWRFGNKRSNDNWDFQRYAMMAKISLATLTTLKKLSIFEEADTDYHRQGRDLCRPSPDGFLSRMIFTASQNLEHLAISTMIDGRDFYQAETHRGMGLPANLSLPTGPLPSWPSLKTLALTCEDLTSTSTLERDAILRAAGEAAKRMPQLQVLELWHHRERDGGLPLRCDPRQSRDIMAGHEQPSRQSGEYHTVAMAQPKLLEKAKTSAVVLQHLQLSELVIHGMSKDQLEKDFLR
ncbi:hypothetical protein G7046_g4472 [Stylonectria norvegica]|nr:hypothetical protein G7046_g4472 [Stylonectria norvegica]